MSDRRPGPTGDAPPGSMGAVQDGALPRSAGVTKKREDVEQRPPIDWSRCAGLDTPNYTQTPDAIFDWVMAYLTGAELKILLYIVRRTFGFKKAEDAISIDQLCNGIITCDGRSLDLGAGLKLGTGLKRPTVLEDVSTLREKKQIITRQQTDNDTGSRPTLYSLNLSEEGVFPAILGNSPGADPRIPGGLPQHTPGSGGADPGGLAGQPRGVCPARPTTDS